MINFRGYGTFLPERLAVSKNRSIKFCQCNEFSLCAARKAFHPEQKIQSSLNMSQRMTVTINKFDY